VDADYYQIIATSPPLRFSDAQRAGTSPAFEEEWHRKLCSLGHSRGWALLSPLSIKEILDPASDVHIVEKTTGAMQGVYMPLTHHVISKRVANAIGTRRADWHAFDVVSVG
jgi:hypothetical protein